ncbi:MAG: chitinase [Flavonifractor plautii]
MIGSCELKARVEESLGTVLDPDFFGQAEQYARRKLDMCNERAGASSRRRPAYGDEYLVLLTADTVREMAFSAWCEIRKTRRSRPAQKAVGA